MRVWPEFSKPLDSRVVDKASSTGFFPFTPLVTPEHASAISWRAVGTRERASRAQVHSMASDRLSRLKKLAEFAKRLREPGASFGKLAKAAGSTIHMGTATQSAVGSDFVTMAYDAGWVIDFDWVAWKQTKRAAELHNDRNALSKATDSELAKLLTALIREDRFAEGALVANFQSGLLLAIADRAQALVAAGVGSNKLAKKQIVTATDANKKVRSKRPKSTDAKQAEPELDLKPPIAGKGSTEGRKN
jgi:uncharacterized protein DUF6508